MKNALNPMAAGKAFGAVWTLGVVLVAIMANINGYGANMIEALGTVYLGLDLTLMGIIIGALWAFVDGFIGGWLVAWLYNKFA